MTPPRLNMPVSDDANELITNDPFALLIALVLDQQVPLERAFSAPLELKQRLGGELTVEQIAHYDEEALVTIFCQQPALHRFPAANARRVQKMANIIVDEYDSDAAAVWTSAKDGTQLLKNVKALPGFGEQKAKIFIAMLGKQMELKTKGWREVSQPFGEPKSALSIADIKDAKSLAAVRQYKQEKKAAAKALAEK